MPTTEKTLRVLIVDDNRDRADAFGLLVEELANQVHVTYGGTQALGAWRTYFRACDGGRFERGSRREPATIARLLQGRATRSFAN